MTPASERKKRLRARQRNGEIVAPVTIGNDVIVTLIDLGRIREQESEDRKQLGYAIAEILSELAVSHNPKFSGTRGQPNRNKRGLIAPTETDDASKP